MQCIDDQWSLPAWYPTWLTCLISTLGHLPTNHSDIRDNYLDIHSYSVGYVVVVVIVYGLLIGCLLCNHYRTEPLGIEMLWPD